MLRNNYVQVDNKNDIKTLGTAMGTKMVQMYTTLN